MSTIDSAQGSESPVVVFDALCSAARCITGLTRFRYVMILVAEAHSAA